jgi:hypothetical protein
VSRPASVEDIHATARAMPHVTAYRPDTARPVYQVGSKSFVFFRTPRPDAVDPETGERYDDVIVLWVASEGDKQALVQDERLPFFTTPHFDGHRRSCSGRRASPRSTATSRSRSSRRHGSPRPRPAGAPRGLSRVGCRSEVVGSTT